MNETDQGNSKTIHQLHLSNNFNPSENINPKKKNWGKKIIVIGLLSFGVLIIVFCSIFFPLYFRKKNKNENVVKINRDLYQVSKFTELQTYYNQIKMVNDSLRVSKQEYINEFLVGINLKQSDSYFNPDYKYEAILVITNSTQKIGNSTQVIGGMDIFGNQNQLSRRLDENLTTNQSYIGVAKTKNDDFPITKFSFYENGTLDKVYFPKNISKFYETSLMNLIENVVPKISNELYQSPKKNSSNYISMLRQCINRNESNGQNRTLKEVRFPDTYKLGNLMFKDSMYEKERNTNIENGDISKIKAKEEFILDKQEKNKEYQSNSTFYNDLGIEYFKVSTDSDIILTKKEINKNLVNILEMTTSLLEFTEKTSSSESQNLNPNQYLQKAIKRKNAEVTANETLEKSISRKDFASADIFGIEVQFYAQVKTLDDLFAYGLYIDFGNETFPIWEKKINLTDEDSACFKKQTKIPFKQYFTFVLPLELSFAFVFELDICLRKLKIEELKLKELATEIKLLGGIEVFFGPSVEIAKVGVNVNGSLVGVNTTLSLNYNIKEEKLNISQCFDFFFGEITVALVGEILSYKGTFYSYTFKINYLIHLGCYGKEIYIGPDGNITYCDTYSSKVNCSVCIKGYVFVNNNYQKCVPMDELKNNTNYYSEYMDGTYSFKSCNLSLPDCQSCYSSSKCKSCNSGFILEKNISANTSNCLPSSGFTECPSSKNNCDKCDSQNRCVSCKKDYVFLDDNRDQCYSNESLKSNDSMILLYEDNYGSCHKLLNNCLYCSSKDKCDKCQEGFSLAEKVNHYKGECVSDEEDIHYFIKDNIYYLCKYSVSDCEHCTKDGNCTKCESGYVFVNDNKQECRSTFALIFTSDEYIKNDTHYYTCDYKINKCKKCKSLTNCTECISGYAPLYNKTDECKNITEMIGYYEDDGILYPCDKKPNCLLCTKDACTKCKDGYLNTWISQNKKECLPKEGNIYFSNEEYFSCNYSDSKCLTCKSNNGTGGNCLSCEKGYDLYYDGTCKELDKNSTYFENPYYYPCNYNITNCEKCVSKNECTQCSSGYYFFNDIKNQCNSTSFFDLFEDKYVKIDDYNYYECSYMMKNCRYCLNNKTCDECFEGYYLNEQKTKCIKNISNCSSFDAESGLCSTCNKGYIVSKDKQTCEVKIDNCDEQDKGKCLKCKDGYTANNDQTCILCDGNYGIIENTNNCIEKSKILDNYYYSPEINKYRLCSTGVAQCSSCTSSNNCKKCNENYTKINNITSACHLITGLNNEYYKDPNDETNYKKCSDSIVNCEKCTSEKICIKCSIGSVVEGNCILEMVQVYILQVQKEGNNLNIYSALFSGITEGLSFSAKIRIYYINNKKYRALEDTTKTVVFSCPYSNSDKSGKVLACKNEDLNKEIETLSKQGEVGVEINDINLDDNSETKNKFDIGNSQIILPQDKERLDSYKTQQLINQNKISDLSKINEAYSMKNYLVDGVTEGCNFSLKTTSEVTPKNEAFSILLTNPLNSDKKSAQCSLLVKNSKEIPCTLSDDVNENLKVENTSVISKDSFVGINFKNSLYKFSCSSSIQPTESTETTNGNKTITIATPRSGSFVVGVNLWVVFFILTLVLLGA